MTKLWIRGEKAVGECVISVHATERIKAINMYPFTSHFGKVMGHHRLVYCLANGIKPKDIKGLQVLHLCDNRQCVNPDHLRLGTHEQNMQDMVDKKRVAINAGSKGSNAKLTEADVLAIRADRRMTEKELAVKYGVQRSAISKILLRTRWKHI